MIPGITVTRDTVIVTSHHHYHMTRCQIDTWQIFNLKKKIKKFKNKNKKFKKFMNYSI